METAAREIRFIFASKVDTSDSIGRVKSSLASVQACVAQLEEGEGEDGISVTGYGDAWIKSDNLVHSCTALTRQIQGSGAAVRGEDDGEVAGNYYDDTSTSSDSNDDMVRSGDDFHRRK